MSEESDFGKYECEADNQEGKPAIGVFNLIQASYYFSSLGLT